MNKLVEINSINIGFNAANIICLKLLLDSNQTPVKLKKKILVILQRSELIQENLREEEEILL
jgi:hypothetical protein